MTIEQLGEAAAARRIEPVYAVIGSEAALRRRAFEALRGAFLDEHGVQQPGAVTRFEIDADDIGALVDEARSLSLFAMLADGPVRLVWAGGGEELEKADDLGELQRYLAAPVGATCLVIEASTMDRRRAAFRLLAAGAVVIDCAPPRSEADVRRWIAETVKARGYSIDAEAVVLLLEMAGPGITALEQELEKVMLFVGESGGTIRASDLEGLLGRARERTVFDLTDALVSGNADVAMQLLNVLVDDGEEPVRLLAMIAWITRQLVTARDLGARLPEREAMEALGGRWDQRRSLLQRARRSTRESLMASLEACARTDQLVKGLRDSRQGADRLRPARGALEALCRQICSA